MKVIQTALLCALCLILAIATYLAALTLTIKLTSDSRIEQNLRYSVDEGLLSEDSASRHSDFGDAYHRFDMFAECVGLGINLGNQDRSVLYRILATPYISSHSSSPTGINVKLPCKDLVQSLANQPKAELMYCRYWHGYQAYTRAVLSFANLGKLRILNAILMYGCLLYLCFKLEAWFGWPAAPIFLLPYALYSDLFSAPLVTVTAIPLAWTFLSVGLGMRQLELKKRPTTGLYVLVFLCGSIYNFISMLVSPQMAPTLLAFMTIAAFLRWDGQSSRRLLALLQAGCVAFAWFLGFSLTWIAKWALAAMYLGFDVVRSSVLEAASGTGYLSYNNPRTHYLFGATWSILLPVLLPATCVTIVVITGIILFRKAPNGASKDEQFRNCALLQTPLLILIAWTELMRYHSLEHRVYAQRAMMLFIILPLLALLMARREASREACPADAADTPTPTLDANALLS